MDPSKPTDKDFVRADSTGNRPDTSPAESTPDDIVTARQRITAAITLSTNGRHKESRKQMRAAADVLDDELNAATNGGWFDGRE